MLNKRSIKLTLCILGLMIWVGIWYFKDPLISKGVDFAVQAWCRQCLGNELKFTHSTSNKGRLIYDKPLFLDSTASKDGGFCLSADQVILDFSFSFWEGIDIAVTLLEPKFQIVKNNEMIPKLNIKRAALRWMPCQITWSVVNGMIKLEDHSKPDSHNQQFYIALEDFNQDLTNSGTITIRTGSVREGKDNIALKITPEREGTAFELTLTEVEGSDLLKAVHFMKDQYYEWVFDEGAVNGTINIRLDKDLQLIGIKSALKMNHVLLYHSILEAKVYLSDAQLNLCKYEGELGDNLLGLPFIGNIEFSQGAGATFYLNGIPYWEIKEVVGGLSINSPAELDFSLNGIVLRYGRNTDFFLKGSVKKNDLGNYSNLCAQLSNYQGNIATAQVVLKNFDNEDWELEVSLNNVEENEIKVAQTIYNTYDKFLGEINISNGKLSGNARWHWNKGKLIDLRVEHLKVQELKFDWKEWGISASLDEVKGTFGINLAVDNPWETLQADLTISHGTCRLSALNPELGKLSGIQSELMIRHGVVQRSLVKGNLANLVGSIELDWSSPTEVIKCQFQGDSSSLAALFPDEKSKRIASQVLDGKLSLFAAGIRSEGGIKFNGIASSLDPTGFDCFQFGFCLAKPLLEKLHYDQSLDDSEVLHEGLDVTEGWFLCESLPLGKYLTPFVFPDGGVVIEGKSRVQGYFDQRLVTLKYSVKDFRAETQGFKVSFPETDSNTDSLPASHTFYLSDGHHHGTLPVRQGTYFHKETNLLFEEISTDIHFDDNQVHMTNLACDSEGMRFGGIVGLDYSSHIPGNYDISVLVDRVDGQISNMRKFCSHFLGDNLCHFPIEGRIVHDQKESCVKFYCTPDNYKVDAKVYGKIVDGIMQTQVENLSLNQLSLAFFYDLHLNQLRMDPLQAFLIAGGKKTPLADVQGKVEFFGENLDKANFDIEMFRGAKLIAKGVGTLSTNQNGENEFSFDTQRTHFLESPLEIENLIVSSDGHLKQFHCRGKLPMDHFMEEISILGKGLWSWQGPFEHLEDLIQGNSPNFDLCLKDSEWKYRIYGNNVVLGNTPYENYTISARRQGESLIIDQLELEDISLTANVSKLPNRWKVNFIDAEVKDVGKIRLEGEYHAAIGRLDASVKQLEFQLSEFATNGELTQNQGLFKAKNSTSMTVEFTNPSNIRISLSEGEYHLCDHLHYVKGLQCELRENKIKVAGAYRYFNHFYNFLTYISFEDEVKQGRLFISESELSELALADSKAGQQTDTVIADWKWTKEKGISLSRMTGSLGGVDIDLKKDSKEYADNIMGLTGGLIIDLSKAKKLLPDFAIAKMNAWKLGSRLLLEGKWLLSQDDWDNFTFNGELRARDILFKGFLFDRMRANIHYHPSKLLVTNINVMDIAGELFCEHLLFQKKKSGQWQFSAPHLEIKELYPIQLKRTDETQVKAPKSLVINKIELNDFMGDLSDEGSFTGRGHLEFINVHKKLIQNTVLAIPNDIISRIGLNTDVLNPAMGEIHYYIREGKFWLTDFKNVFSEGAISRFYLPPYYSQSYVDFDGNLNIRVKMKQYNLIFKIAELFTVSVQGNLSKPTYTIQKQPEVASADIR